MNKSVFLAALLAAILILDISGPQAVRGEIVYSGSGITENFDSLGTAVVTNTFAGAVGVQSAVPGTTGFEAAHLPGSNGATSSLLISAGDLGTGGIQSMGTLNASDRALGMLASGTRTMAFGFALRNNAAGTTITSITISFNQESWRTPTTANNTLTAAWGTSDTPGVTTSNYLTAAGMTALPALDMTLAFTASNMALDGNLPANRVAKTATFSSLSLAFGDRLFVRWQDVDNSGADAGIGMDDMTISFVTSAVPEAPAFALGAVACGVLGLAWAGRARRRRRCAEGARE